MAGNRVNDGAEPGSYSKGAITRLECSTEVRILWVQHYHITQSILYTFFCFFFKWMNAFFTKAFRRQRSFFRPALLQHSQQLKSFLWLPAPLSSSDTPAWSSVPCLRATQLFTLPSQIFRSWSEIRARACVWLCVCCTSHKWPSPERSLEGFWCPRVTL